MPILIDPNVQEPAHPMFPGLDDIMREIYKYIRDKYQTVINQTFDQVARDIGFVVSATVPMNIEIANGGMIKSLAVSKASPMKGTLIDKALTRSLKPMLKSQISVAKPGTYEFFLIWPEALKFKLHTDWQEPAHRHLPIIDRSAETALRTSPSSAMKMVWESHEPAHWLDPKFKLTDAEAMHISLLDEMYPELRLMERVKAARKG